jgi:hypothetical protein
MSLTAGSGNITRAKPAFIRKDLLPLFHNFLVAPALLAAAPIELAMSTWFLLISLMEAVKALNSSAFNRTHSRNLGNIDSQKEKLVQKTSQGERRFLNIQLNLFNSTAQKS